jgi:hypothetical protein
MKIHRPSVDVRESFSQAQQQAAAMDAGPPPAWNAAARSRARSPRWIGLAVTSVVASGVAGWFGVDWLSGPTASTRPPGPVSPVVGQNAFPKPASDPAVMATKVSTPTVATPLSSLDVKREAGVIRIASNNALLADAVRVLARATHTNVRGGEALASIASPITLHWQGSDTAAAWDALLGRFANIAVSCGSAACELWIVGVNTPRATRGPAANGSTATAEPVQPPRPVVPQDSPPPGDENTETN